MNDRGRLESRLAALEKRVAELTRTTQNIPVRWGKLRRQPPQPERFVGFLTIGSSVAIPSGVGQTVLPYAPQSLSTNHFQWESSAGDDQYSLGFVEPGRYRLRVHVRANLIGAGNDSWPGSWWWTQQTKTQLGGGANWPFGSAPSPDIAGPIDNGDYSGFPPLNRVTTGNLISYFTVLENNVIGGAGTPLRVRFVGRHHGSGDATIAYSFIGFYYLGP